MAREVLFKIRVDDRDLQKLRKFEDRMEGIRNETEKTAKATSKFKNTMSQARSTLNRFAERGLRRAWEFTKEATAAFGEFEQGMADIRKVAGGTTAEIDALGKALRAAVVTDLSGTTTISELQKIATTAAKFGIATKDLAEFSTTIAKMSQLWDISGTKTAENAAKIIDQYQLTMDELHNVGAVIDAVADQYGVSEEYLLAFAQRFSATARLTGMTLDEVATLAAQTSKKTGLAAVTAATQYQGLFQIMSQNIEAVAETFGGTVEEWTRLINQDGLEAFKRLETGLKQIRDTKGPQEYTQVIDDLFGKSKRLNVVIKGMTDSVADLNDTQKTANKEIKNATRITENFSTSVDTQQGRVQKAKAAWNDFRIAIGDRLQKAFHELLVVANESIFPMLQDFIKWLDESKTASDIFGVYLPAAIRASAVALKGIGILLEGFVKLWEIFGTTAGSAIGYIDGLIQDLLRTLERLKKAFNDTINEPMIGFFQKFTDAIYGVERGLEGESLTPALRRYQQEALRAGLATRELSQQMGAMGAELTGPEAKLVNISSKLASFQNLGTGTSPGSAMQITRSLRRQQFQAAEQLQIAHFQQQQAAPTPGATYVTNINFQGNNVVDDNTLGSFVRKITAVQQQQQGRIIGSVA